MPAAKSRQFVEVVAAADDAYTLKSAEFQIAHWRDCLLTSSASASAIRGGSVKRLITRVAIRRFALAGGSCPAGATTCDTEHA